MWQIPGVIWLIEVQANLAGGTCKRKMGFRDQLSGLCDSLSSKILNLTVRNPLIGSIDSLSVLCYAERSEALPAEPVKDGQIVALGRLIEIGVPPSKRYSSEY